MRLPLGWEGERSTYHWLAYVDQRMKYHWSFGHSAEEKVTRLWVMHTRLRMCARFASFSWWSWDVCCD